MSGPKDILCVSNTTWEGFYTKSTVQIMSLLAARNKVLFVEYPFTVKDLIYSISGKGRAPVARLTGLKKRLTTVNPFPGVSVFHLVVPPMLPVEFIKNAALYNIFQRLNTMIYAHSVRRHLKKLGMPSPVCINAYNSAYGNNLLGAFREKLHLFYCYDGPNTGRYGPKAIESDRGFAAKTDAVIATSEFLADALKKYNQEVYVVRNGVDTSLFIPHAKTEPSDSSARKKACYIGSIDQRFDIETVDFAIKSLPDMDFEFTGELMNRNVEEQLSGYPNVRFNPPVKAEDVPSLLKRCDVGLIPYICNEYTRNIYPLKINEYLSVGVPVVLTSFADLPEFNSIVSFTKGKEDFARAILRETESDNSDKISERIAFAGENSWENRALRFEEIIDKLLDKK